MQDTRRIIQAYYDSFNARDSPAFLDLLTEDVEHGINQGRSEAGKPAFAAFISHMARCYDERLSDLVIFTEPTGTRAAAEFTVHGRYLQADIGMPPAHGQSYTLPAGAFFSLRDGRIARVIVYYNLPDWISQVSR